MTEGKIELPKTYWGARFTSDAMDCDLPISIDSRSGCTYGCKYCFSNSLMRDTTRNEKKKNQLQNFHVSQTEFNPETFIKLLEGKMDNHWARAMKPLIENKCPLQLGALGDPFDELDPHTGWFLKVLPHFARLDIPMRVSTKGARVLLRPEYVKALTEHPNRKIWFAFSIISSDDELIKKIDCGAPETSVRMKAIKMLTSLGYPCSLRYRPIIPPVAQRIMPNGKTDWMNLIDLAKEAGVRAISFEQIFLNQMANEKQRKLYREMCAVMGCPDFPMEWKHHSIKNQPCLRANRFYKYNLMMSIRNYAKNAGLVVGISDPHFKEYGDYGCCCGIPRSDAVFGHYSTSMTDLVIKGRKTFERTGKNLQFRFTDFAPSWGQKIAYTNMCNVGDADKKMVAKYKTWYDNIRDTWNEPKHPRSPYNYFEGILFPVGVDELKNVIYEYRDWATQVWKKPLPKLDVELKVPDSTPIEDFKVV